MKEIPSAYSELRKNLDSGSISCVDTVNHYLSKIKERERLNVFISLFEKEALEQAKVVDEKLKNGTAGELAGMVISIKDVISVKDSLLTCGSKILSNFNAIYDATAIKRLKEADAILIGKVNCDEFAMGSSNENSFFGVTRNPIDETRVPGGSSGASAVSVAADMCMVSLGSETGGSIRQPASFCGITGLKATYGRISRFGLVAFASSCDSIGIFAKENENIARVMKVIAGKDEQDSTSADVEVPNYTEEIKEKLDPKKIKIGFAKEYFGEGLNEEIKQTILAKLEHLKNKGFEIVEVELPYSKYGIPVYYILTSAEASSNLSRYDGVRYGVRSEKSDAMEDMYVNTRSEGFGPEVKRRIMLGTYVLSSGYYDAYYRKGQKVRRLIKQDFESAFEKVDYIISPTTPTTAFKIGDKTDDPLAMYLNDIYTVSVNLAGNCGLSVPIGKDKEGLPFGIQVIGRKFDEAGLLKMADLLSE
jgi:aspartyl-tRNA(Asn)/glutamyl-tRNA(Gln) amidotransferase subunit A